ncbi:hypothetical protein A4A49_14794 [Nicotiana attenuata]|uniref:Ubiquitin-like protease family profile domain-containing protein n=1 Tax=Nicotiana attenuata TaxID=49451 RepID=A0A1J6HYH1_NICAT|nr:hypothetical protein A4A49_14794 [Nicotiana attenuata]
MTSIYAIFQEVHPYLISTRREMDMDYMKNSVPYDNEVAGPIIDHLALHTEWVTAIKKTLGAASLETNDEADIADNDPLGGSILGSPLVGGFSDIGRGGSCRMCNAQPSDTDVCGELKVVNEKLDKHVEELLSLMRVCNIKYPRLYTCSHAVMGVSLCNNMFTTWDNIKEASSKEEKDLDFCETVDVCQVLCLTPLMLYPQGSMPRPGDVEWCKAKMLYCVWQIDNTYFVHVIFHLAEGLIRIYDNNVSLYDDGKQEELVQALALAMLRILMKTGQFADLGQDVLTKKWSWERIMDVPAIRQSESSGAYAVKVIDFLLTDTSLDQLNDKRIELIREKFAVISLGEGWTLLSFILKLQVVLVMRQIILGELVVVNDICIHMHVMKLSCCLLTIDAVIFVSLALPYCITTGSYLVA